MWGLNKIVLDDSAERYLLKLTERQIERHCKAQLPLPDSGNIRIISNGELLLRKSTQICRLHCAATHAPALTKHEPPLAGCTTLSWLHLLHLHDPIATPGLNVPNCTNINIASICSVLYFTRGRLYHTYLATSGHTPFLVHWSLVTGTVNTITSKANHSILVV